MVHIIEPDIKLIEASTKARADKCTRKIEKVLNAFDCVLVPNIQIIGDRVFSQVLVQANERNLDA